MKVKKRKPGTTLADLVSTFEQLLKKAVRTSRGVTALDPRREQLRSLLDAAGANYLTVGVVGITSSGKSTFLNGLMGEELLPEESRATTNVIVRCRRGARREVVVLYTNGKKETFRGRDVTAALFKKFSSEKHNPGNRRGVRIIEWTSPRTHIPDGLVLVDSPGLDAYGLEEHRDLTLRQVLPMADIVIYMTSIRNPFKSADLVLVERLVENDQRVLFTLTMADTERDSHQGGEIIRTREQKLARHLQRLKNDIARYTRLRTYGIVLVSSKLAKEARFDRRSKAWRDSNFGEVLVHLRRFTRDLDHIGVESRVRRAGALLDHCVEACVELLRAGSNPVAVSHVPARAGMHAGRNSKHPRARIEILEATISALTKDAEDALDKSRQTLGKAALRAIVNQKTHGCRTLPAFRLATAQIRQAIETRKKTMLSLLDECRYQGDEALEAAGVTSKPPRHQRQIELQSAPDLSVHRDTETVSVKKKRKLLGFIPWFSKTVQKTVETYDPAAARGDLRDYTDAVSRQIATYLDWWKQTHLIGFVGPLESELGDERRALMALERALREAEQERVKTQQALENLTRLQTEIEELARRVKALRRRTTAHRSPFPDAGSARRKRRTKAPQALIPLIETFREQSYQQEIVGRLTSFLGKPPRRMLMLGTWRHRGTRFLASMAHDLSLAEKVEGLDGALWLLAGNKTGFRFRGPHEVLRVQRCVFDSMLLVVAPNDEHLRSSHVRWRKLFSTFDAIGIELEADRVHSGVADIARAVYQDELAHFKDRIFLTCGHGAAFDDRLAHLVTDVRPALQSFGFANDIPLLVFEDYDLRYTHFLELAEEIAGMNFGLQHFMRSWRKRRLPATPPFTHDVLERAFAKVIA